MVTLFLSPSRAQKADSSQSIEPFLGCECCADTIDIEFPHLDEIWGRAIKSKRILQGWKDHKLSWERDIDEYNIESGLVINCLMRGSVGDRSNDCELILLLSGENITRGVRIRMSNGKQLN